MASTPSSIEAPVPVAPGRARTDVQRAIVLAFACFALVWLALQMAVVDDAVPVIAPAVGVTLAALVLYGRRLVYGAFVGLLAAYLVVGIQLSLALPLSLGAALTALAAAWLLAKAPDFRATLSRGRDVFAFISMAVVCAPLVGATIGVAAMLVGNLVAPGRIWTFWLALWDSEALGILLFAPAALGWAICSAPARLAA